MNMFKIYSRIILIILLVTTGWVLSTLISRSSDEDLQEKFRTEAATHSAFIGAYIEHIMSERLEKLEDMAKEKKLSDQSLTDYSSFIRKHYNTQGAFGVGRFDSFYRIQQSQDFGGAVCSQNSLIDIRIKNTIEKGKPFTGFVSEKCGEESLYKKRGFIIVTPIMRDGGFEGGIYDVFTVLDNSGNIWQKATGGSQIDLVINSTSAYPEGSKIWRLLKAHEKSTESYALLDGKYIGYYPFQINGLNLCIIYQTEKFISVFHIPGIPDRYTLAVFLSPIILVLIGIAMELFRINREMNIKIKERTKTVEELKNRYEGLFSTIPEYVLVFKPDGTVLERNARCEDLGCCSVGGVNIYDHIKESGRFRDRVLQMNNGETENLGEFFLNTEKGGINVAVSVTCLKLGKEKAILAALTDITEYKKMQNSFFLLQKRDAVGTIAAGMAHDFSNILQNISLQYGLAERSDDDDKRDRHLENISGIVEGARKYLHGIMQSTKNSQEQVVVKEGFQLTKEAIEVAERILPPDVSVKYSDSSEGARIRTEESRYLQMIINLCQNAADAMGRKGQIEITSEHEDKVYGSFFVLSVKDKGTGIDKSDLGNIFKPFYTTKTGTGTGLGLASVKKTVMDSGGMIDVKSREGEGTEFIIMIPEIK